MARAQGAEGLSSRQTLAGPGEEATAPLPRPSTQQGWWVPPGSVPGKCANF